MNRLPASLVDRHQTQLLRWWLLFAVSALGIAGVFAFLAVLTRAPAIQILHSAEALHRAIAGHVTFSLLVWLLAFEAVLWILALGRRSGERSLRGGLALATAGSGFLIVAVLRGQGEPVLTDYVSVVVDPPFFVGLAAVVGGVGLVAWTSARGQRPLPLSAAAADGAGAAATLRYGMPCAAAAMALAVGACAIAFVRLAGAGGVQTDFTFFQSLFWIPGHLLQFVNAAAMAVAWYLLAQFGFGVVVPSGRLTRLAFAAYPALAALLFAAALSADLRALPSNLELSIAMGLAVALPTLLHLGLVTRALLRERRWSASPEAAALVCSLALFGIGILLAVARARTGSSMWIPAHYHAVVVGGVTMAFMGLTYRLLAETGQVTWPRLGAVQPWLYGAGMLLMVIGMNWAGTAGAPRKTFDPALGAAAAGWVTPMNLMGLGGVIAVLGGASFVGNALASLLAPAVGAERSATAVRLGRWATLFKLRIAVLITFTGIAAALLAAPSPPAPATLALLTVTLLMASASAGALNHVLDMDVDARMARTRARPLPSGQIGRGAVTGVALLLLGVALTTAALGMNRIVALHLLGGAFIYVVIYTAWLKRRSTLNIVVGGLAGSFAALAGGASVRAELCLPPVLLAAIIFLWTPPHFWALAILYRDEYRAAGVPMLPVVQGTRRTAWWMLAHAVVLVGVSLLPMAFGARGPFYAATAAVLGLYFIARNIRLLRQPSPGTARAAFKASLVYLTLLLLVMVADLRV